MKNVKIYGESDSMECEADTKCLSWGENRVGCREHIGVITPTFAQSPKDTIINVRKISALISCISSG